VSLAKQWRSAEIFKKGKKAGVMHFSVWSMGPAEGSCGAIVHPLGVKGVQQGESLSEGGSREIFSSFFMWLGWTERGDRGVREGGYAVPRSGEASVLCLLLVGVGLV
jgi:hypothetical protein